MSITERLRVVGRWLCWMCGHNNPTGNYCRSCGAYGK
jgi:hypothetical protein